jgi:uncharacterized membrane protein YfcA
VSFLALIAAGSLIAGAIAAVSGFGIGSILTPLLQRHYDMRLAVAAVSGSGKHGASWTETGAR